VDPVLEIPPDVFEEVVADQVAEVAGRPRGDSHAGPSLAPGGRPQTRPGRSR
jgi:hypothetical protein